MLKRTWRGTQIPYDTQTRSILQTDHRDTALSSDSGTVNTNADGSVDVYFGPKAPAGKASNWIQTSLRRARAMVRRDLASGEIELVK